VEPIQEIRAQLTGPGGPFETVWEQVLGEKMEVFKSRAGSLREILQQSALRGDEEHIVYEDRRIGFAEHARLVASVARALDERYGIRPGDRVAILAANRPEWIITFWATVSLGGIVAALNGWWAAEEIRFGIEHSEPKLVVADRKRLTRVKELGLDVNALEIESEFAALERYAPDAPLPSQPIAEDDPAVILYTAGTTGRPKGAVASHRSVIGFVQANSMHGLERLMLAMRQPNPPVPDPNAPPPCNLVTTPLFHLSGLYAMAIMMLAQGIKTVYRAGRFDPEDVLRLIERERITMWGALGGAATRVMNCAAFGRYDVSSLRNVGFGGAPTSPALQERIEKAFPSSSGGIGLGYGLSESAGLGAVTGGRDLTEHPTSSGRATVGHQIEIRDDGGDPVPDGVYGEIFLRSPYLMLEYWRDAEATARAIGPGRWLATGDIGCLREGYLYINSRARDLILRAAENVYPVEIEHRLDAHPSVVESAVVGVDHDVLGQEVKAIVVAAEGSRVDTDELAGWVGEVLAPFKVPSQWEVRTELLPRNPGGKVMKDVLTGDANSRFVEE
jgi:long-chain acyl-CoA synthetase